jgi:hypothetical protein
MHRMVGDGNGGPGCINPPAGEFLGNVQHQICHFISAFPFRISAFPGRRLLLPDEEKQVFLRRSLEVKFTAGETHNGQNAGLDDDFVRVKEIPRFNFTEFFCL